MLDLFKQQYDYQTLKENIYSVSLRDILKTQKLSINFCVKYILNTNYQLNKEDENISISEVIKFQPHISRQQLLIAFSTYSPDDDSFEDFDSYSRRH